MKGQKTGGRTTGTKNKVTADFREKINSFLSKNWEQVQHDFNVMEPKDRLQFLEKLLKYSVPVLSAVSAIVEYEKMSDEDLELLVNKII